MGIYTRLIKWITSIGAILLILFRVRQSGKDAQQVKHYKQIMQEQEAQHHEIKRQQEIVNRNATTTRNDIVNSLRKGDF
jgi:hypothetical protein